MPYLRLIADCAEPRIKRDRLQVAVDGLLWNELLGSDYWIDPITRSLFLKPLPLTDAWSNTFTSSYARLSKSAYTLTSSLWVENHKRGAGDIYLESLTGTFPTEVVTTASSYSANRAWFVSFFNTGTGDEQQGILECGQGTPGASGTVSLRVRSSGDVEVYVGVNRVGVYDLSSLPNIEGVRKTGKAPNLAGQVVSFLWIPCRRRDLLIYCPTTGGGFVHTADDLDPGTLNNITATGPFWWRILTGKASVQVAPLKFKTSAVAYSHTKQLLYPPEAGRTFEVIDAADSPGYGTTTRDYVVVNADTLATFVPDGFHDRVRVATVLTGDGDWSDAVYAADLVSEHTTTTTYADEYDMTCEVANLSLDVDEEGAATVKFAIPQVNNSSLPRLETTPERPFRLAVTNDADTVEVDVIRGTLAAPVINYGADKENATLDRLEFTGYDRTREFERYRFLDFLPLDGFLLTDALAYLAETPGFDVSDLDISLSSFLLPYTPGVSTGEWALFPDFPGDSVQDWIERLLRDYAATWKDTVGWRPTPTGYKWVAKDPADLSTTPKLELFQSREDAYTFGLSAAATEQRILYKDGRKDLLNNPEANQIITVGQDPRLKNYLYAQSNDNISQNPELVPASRPINWLGRLERYIFADPSLTTQAAANRARDILSGRLLNARNIEEWQCPFLIRATDTVPVWRGDVIRLYETVTGTGAGTWTDWRVLSLSARFEYTPDAKILAAPAQYKVERIGSTPAFDFSALTNSGYLAL